VPDRLETRDDFPCCRGSPLGVFAQEPHDEVVERLGDVGVVARRWKRGDRPGVAEIFDCLRGVCVVTCKCKVHDCTEAVEVGAVVERHPADAFRCHARWGAGDIEHDSWRAHEAKVDEHRLSRLHVANVSRRNVSVEQLACVQEREGARDVPSESADILDGKRRQLVKVVTQHEVHRVVEARAIAAKLNHVDDGRVPESS